MLLRRSRDNANAMQSLWQTEASTTWPFGKDLGLISCHPGGCYVPFLSDWCSYCNNHIASQACGQNFGQKYTLWEREKDILELHQPPVRASGSGT